MLSPKENHLVRYNRKKDDAAEAVKITEFMTAEESEGHGRLFAKVEIPAGDGIACHEHHGEFEVYYILEGNGVINDNGEEKGVHAGDMHKCQDGCSHSIKNTGSSPLVMLAMILTSEA